jgi:flagellar basal-body rod protein FlgC
MRITNAFDISTSALTAQRMRMDVISSNIANAETTRGRLVDGKWVPYARKLVHFSPVEKSFSQILNEATDTTGRGVTISKITEDRTPFKRVFNPTHPDSDENGYLLMPNVDPLKEMVDMISATRSYEANVAALNASKIMFAKALDIGKQ